MSEDNADLARRIQGLEEENRKQKEEIERLKNENRRWARLAGTEALTGLPNKVSFMRAFVPQAIQRAVQEQKPAGFLLLSADNLGVINEAHGREAGDQVIRGLAELLQSLLDEQDRVGHIDGTHFAAILYPADLDTTRGRANMVRARVRAHGFPCADEVVQITVSVGIVALEPVRGVNGRTAGETVFQRLNEALYSAKKAGGNRVEVVQMKDLDGKDTPL